MKKTLITNGSVVRNGAVIHGSVLFSDTILDADFCGDVPEDTEVIDAAGSYVLPGFIELHAHGGGGADFIDNTKEAARTILDTHLSHGVTTLCPTLVACEWERALDFLRFYADLSDPLLGGVHLEGPFLSRVMCGAQNLGCIVAPTKRHIDELREFAPMLSHITAAPEVDGVFALAEAMLPLGVRMSVGHSDADTETMRRAADIGFDLITHLFCSTSRRHKVGSYVCGGIEENALIDDRFTVELIGDGHHICKESLLLTQKCKGIDGICIVSDAMRAAGSTSDGESYLGEVKPENRVILEDGVAKLPDRSSFAGSLAVGDTMIQALCGRYGLPISDISHMMSAVPARLLGKSETVGKIELGLCADLVILDQTYRTSAVYKKGVKLK